MFKKIMKKLFNHDDFKYQKDVHPKDPVFEQFVPPKGTMRPGDIAWGNTDPDKDLNTPVKFVAKKKTVLLSTLVLDSISEASYFYHLAFAYRCGRNVPDYKFYLASLKRVAIDKARNVIASQALLQGMEYTFFWDSDTHLHPDLMERMIDVMERNPDIYAISPLYRVRGYPFEMMAYIQDGMKPRSITKEELLKKADADGLTDVAIVGNGCTLVRTAAYALWDGPWYKTGAGNTEDAWFCSLLKYQKPDARIVVDTTMQCGHEMGDAVAVWEDNVEGLSAMYNPDGGWYRNGIPV